MAAETGAASTMVSAAGGAIEAKDPFALDASRGVLILLIGLPAVGKSSLTRRIVPALGASVIDRDDMAKAIFPDQYFLWTRPQMKSAGEVCAKVAETVLTEQPGARLIIDGFTFSRASDIEMFAEVGRRTGTRVIRVHCFADEDVVRRRIEKDSNGLSKRRDWSMYTSVRDRFEPLEKVDVAVDLTIDEVGAAQKVLDCVYNEGK